MYGFWVVWFAIQKPIFMIVNYTKGLSLWDYLSVVLHGIKLDLCFSSYLLFIPVLIYIFSFFIHINLKKILSIYTIVFSSIISIIFSIDCVLYSYWGFRIDASVIFYMKNPADVTASITLKDVFKFLLILLPYLFLMLLSFRYTIYKLIENKTSNKKIIDTIISVVCLGVLVIASRGGLSTSTANVGMVYYSNNQFLNQSAINPVFSLFSSLSKNEDFSKEFIFYDERQCEKDFSSIYTTPQDTTMQVLNTTRPNVVVVILESFTANMISSVGGENGVSEQKEITPNLNKIANEGIVFTNAYSNGMRTDRGIVSILTGFLAQPTLSIIKYPEKTRSLPSLAKSLHAVGYSTSMLYGGDVDFANMRSYFFGSMYSKITCDKDFPINERLSKWGVRDENTFSYLYNDIIKANNLQKPYFKTFLTLSSHEPFDVSSHSFTDKYLNSASYTDSCIGSFVSKLQQTKAWNNLLIVFVADHGYPYPKDVKDYERRKYHIPIIMCGGAVKRHLVVDRLCNQTDIPTTILRQMHLPTKQFTYGKDLFNPYSPQFAFYVYTNGFCFLDPTGYTIYDNNSNKVVECPNSLREKKGKVILQTLYRDISKR